MNSYYITYKVPPLNEKDKGIRNIIVQHRTVLHAKARLKEIFPKIIKIISATKVSNYNVSVGRQ